MAKYLTDLADVLRKAGLTVVEIPGWKTRGRPGDFNPRGVLCHHTAGAGDGYADAYYMAVTGRTDLPAPLAQLALSRKGVWHVLAAGRANHAGKCKAVGGLTAGDGNEQMIGVEAQNRGTDAEDWSPEQYGSYVRGVAALTKHYGWRAPLGHKETSTSGKVDPDFPMDKFRRDVAASKEDDMPTVHEVWTTDLTKTGRIGGAEVLESPLDILTRVARNVEFTAGLVKAMGNASDVAAAVIKALPPGTTVDEATLSRAFVAALTELATPKAATP